MFIAVVSLCVSTRYSINFVSWSRECEQGSPCARIGSLRDSFSNLRDVLDARAKIAGCIRIEADAITCFIAPVTQNKLEADMTTPQVIISNRRTTRRKTKSIGNGFGIRIAP